MQRFISIISASDELKLEGGLIYADKRKFHIGTCDGAKEKPDIALTKYKIAIFCDSEFFHGKDWKVLKPRLENSNNSECWIKKISRNIERDNEINKQLLFMGVTVIRFWGKVILKDIDTCIQVVEETIWDTVFEEASNDL